MYTGSVLYSGLVVGTLDSRSSSMVSSPGQGDCIMFLAETLHFTVALSQGGGGYSGI